MIRKYTACLVAVDVWQSGICYSSQLAWWCPLTPIGRGDLVVTKVWPPGPSALSADVGVGGGSFLGALAVPSLLALPVHQGPACMERQGVLLASQGRAPGEVVTAAPSS